MVVHGKGDVFRIYNHNERLAVQTLLNAFVKYSDTENKEYKEYWEQLINQVKNGNYTIIKSDDFMGVRRVT